MFAVVFEVHPGPGKKNEYLGLAKHLKPILESIDGFIDNERFASKRREGWVLSLSTWRDEKSVVRWRAQGEHHRVQERGRFEVFSDYHLRVCEVTADSHPPEGLPVREQRFDKTETGEAKARWPSPRSRPHRVRRWPRTPTPCRATSAWTRGRTGSQTTTCSRASTTQARCCS